MLLVRIDAGGSLHPGDPHGIGTFLRSGCTNARFLRSSQRVAGRRGRAGERTTDMTLTPLPDGATAQSGALHEMWTVFFWAGVGVAIVVYGLIAWCVLRYRAVRRTRHFRRSSAATIGWKPYTPRFRF